MTIVEDNIRTLADLQQFPQWVCFTPEKEPINPRTGNGAMANNPRTWTILAQAYQAWHDNAEIYAGIGFEFVKEQRITGIDLDKCIEHGEIKAWALEIVQRFNSYTEISPSGKGLHIWVRGSIPATLGSDTSDPDIRIEMYDHEHYLTVTGQKLAGTPDTIEDRQELLLQLHEKEKARRRQAKEAKRQQRQQQQQAPTTPRPAALLPAADSPYGLAALKDECQDLATTGDGARNTRLNLAAYNLGRLVGGNELSRSTAEEALFAAAERSGLSQMEIEKTLKSGLEAGMREPRTRPVDDVIYGPANGHRGDGGNGSHSGNGAAGGSPSEPDTQFVIECLREGEYGDSLLFAFLFRGLVLFDYTAQEWYTWKGHWWEVDNAGKIKHLVSGRLASCYLKTGATLNQQASQQEAKAEISGDDQEKAAAKERVIIIKKLIKELTDRAFTLRQVSRCKNILYFAQSHDGMGITADQWDLNPWLLAVPNGVIDLHTGTLRDGKPDDYIRTAAPTVWKGLDEPAPRWERFLQEIFEDRPADLRTELITFKQRLLGYGITGEVIEHIFAILYGEDGRNGKDTMQKILSKTLGSASGAIHKDVLLDAGRGHSAGAPTPHLSALQGKRLAWANEPEKGARFNVGQIKDLSGGGDIPTRGLHEKKYTNIKPSHLLLLLTNHKPHADANDSAFWERVIMIPFNIRFVEHPVAPNERQRDTTLWTTLESETSGILAWLVRGCLLWQREGLNIPDQVRAAVLAYRDEEDDLRTFLDECCVIKEGLSIKASTLYSAYEKWAQSGNIYVLNRTQFGLQLAKKKIEKEKKGLIKYIGIGLLDSFNDSSLG